MSVYDEIREYEKEKNAIRSKSMFTDDYDYEMKVLVEKAKEIVDKFIIPEYDVEYTSYWRSSLKIRISDDNKSIHKLIECKFLYKKNDVKFWYINLEILYSQKSRKTITKKMWRFPILEQDSIIKVFAKTLLEVIEEY